MPGNTKMFTGLIDQTLGRGLQLEKQGAASLGSDLLSSAVGQSARFSAPRPGSTRPLISEVGGRTDLRGAGPMPPASPAMPPPGGMPSLANPITAPAGAMPGRGGAMPAAGGMPGRGGGMPTTPTTLGVSGGPTLGSNQAGGELFNFRDATNFLGIGTGITASAMAGGVASYATGGEFGQGAVMGAMAGVGVRAGMAGLKANRSVLAQGMRNLETAGAKEGAGWGASAAGSASAFMLKAGPSMNAISNRQAIMAGAGLMGVMGGGNRQSNHRRGFNKSRGNRF